MHVKWKFIHFFTLSFVCFIFFGALLTSCTTSKKNVSNFIYFKEGAETASASITEPLIKPNDLLNIQVYSRTLNQEQAAIFNIPATAAGAAQGYIVNSAGEIEMPVIGLIKAAGITKDQLQTLLVQKLSNNVKNPSVFVSFLQFNINVLGEVRAPGTQKFTVDKVTIIDALSAAGDLTDLGRRENIMVTREESGKRKYYTVDISNKAIFESPVYLMQPNDIIYVSPNESKMRTLNANSEGQRKTSLFLTIFSTLITLTTLVISFTR